MSDRKYDRSFYVKTTGTREWPDGTIDYNRCESTPYSALEKLSKRYKLNKNDNLVDFGSGRGRVTFYLHNRFRIPVTGIEAHDKTIDEAINNKESYRSRNKHINAPIKFKYTLAENYPVKLTDNKFYFFNPFSVKIFEEVVFNILKSVEQNERSVDLILYYPMNKYKNFLENNTPFELLNKIKVPKSKDSKKKFLIYRLNK